MIHKAFFIIDFLETFFGGYLFSIVPSPGLGGAGQDQIGMHKYLRTYIQIYKGCEKRW
jgi:hypothetical protein